MQPTMLSSFMPNVKKAFHYRLNRPTLRLRLSQNIHFPHATGRGGVYWVGVNDPESGEGGGGGAGSRVVIQK